MGKWKEYFGRGFVVTINENIKVNVKNDINDLEGNIKKLECKFNEESIKEINELDGRIVKLRIKKSENILYQKNVKLEVKLKSWFDDGTRYADLYISEVK